MYISESTRQAYTEIDNFIELLDENNKNKIPIDIREIFKQYKDNNYVKNIDVNIPIKEQNLKEETLALIALLNLQYWCDDETEKGKLKKIYAENEEKYQKDLREKYNPDDLFKNRKKVEANNSILVVEKEVWYKKIFEFIKNLLNF